MISNVILAKLDYSFLYWSTYLKHFSFHIKKTVKIQIRSFVKLQDAFILRFIRFYSIAV